MARLKRHGALCKRSAATPPTCATDADVPKNTLPNDPAPVTDTPSMADTSGFTRPSRVGPRLLKNSTVEFEVSRQDSLVDDRPAAAGDAEQIAPTATALVGEPPASLCAGTLRPGVLKLRRSCCGGASTSGPPVAHCGRIAKMFRRRICAASRTF